MSYWLLNLLRYFEIISAGDRTAHSRLLDYRLIQTFVLYECTAWSAAAIAQSVYRLATSWTVRGSNPGGGEGGEISRNRPDRPWGAPILLCNVSVVVVVVLVVGPISTAAMKAYCTLTP
jgi:hypothetical protein